MDGPEVKHVSRRCPGREVPGSDKVPDTLFKPDDCVIQLDTQIYLHEIDLAEEISGRYPGKVWVAPNMLIELNTFKEMPPKKRKKMGICIDDFGGHIARVYKSASCLGGEPFNFPTFLEMCSDYGDRGTEAARAIEAAAHCAYGGESCNGTPSCADMGLFIGPVLGNGDEFEGNRYLWLIFSRDRKVQGTGKNLRTDGYHVVTVGHEGSLYYHADKFL